MKNKLVSKLLAGALVLSSALPLAGSMPVYAEEQKKNKWVMEQGKWYYYNADGSMVKNQTITFDGEQYQIGEDGAWIESEEQRKEREAQEAQIEANMKAYKEKYPETKQCSEDYKKSDDRWTNKDGNWYYDSKFDQLVFGAIGSYNVKDNWEKVNGYWYHFNKDGIMEKDVTIKDECGNDCVLNSDGVLTNREEPQFK